MINLNISEVIVLVILCFTTCVSSLNEELVKEQACWVPDTENVSLDYEWLLSNSDWYFPIQSKLDLYRTSWDLLQKSPSEITETELKSGCIRSVWNGFTPMIIGHEQQLNYEFTPMSDNVFIFTASWRDGDGGKMYLAKTDNQSYIVFLKCWDDGQMSWNVMSSVKSLELDTKYHIMDYIKSLGFQESNFIEEDYSSCNLKTDKSEL